MTAHVVIVGSGQAGVQAAFSLRDLGFAGEIAIVGEELEAPYQRPPLSKAYLLGKLHDEALLLKSRELYSQYGIDLRLGIRVEAIDRSRRQVRLRDGAKLPYDHLILATGARQRSLAVQGAGLGNVLALRTVDDARRLRASLDGVRRAVVVGGGFIGLEFAAVARARGVDVLVIEIQPRLMARALSAEMAFFFKEQHAASGVQFLFGAAVKAFHGAGRVQKVQLTHGPTIEADLVLVGVGVLPNVELAEAAGLRVADGVLVDELLCTNDPAISAIGDCARGPSPFSALGLARLESVQNAADQARCVASRITGAPKPFGAVPWFWSDQRELKLQIAGLGAGHDTVVIRGDPARGAFSVFCFKEGRLLAVESVNRGPDHIVARRLIASGVRLTPRDAADEGKPLRAFLPRADASVADRRREPF